MIIYIGFSLKRQFDEAKIACDVIAPSMIPEISSDRVKTDRLDSKRLAIYYKKGLLTIVHVPNTEEETHRRLVRSRYSLIERSSSLKKEILFHCRLYGYNYKLETKGKSYWTQMHTRWLQQMVSDEKKDFFFRKVLENYLFLLESFSTSIENLETEIHKLIQTEKYKKKVFDLPPKKWTVFMFLKPSFV